MSWRMMSQYLTALLTSGTFERAKAAFGCAYRRQCAGQSGRAYLTPASTGN